MIKLLDTIFLTVFCSVGLLWRKKIWIWSIYYNICLNQFLKDKKKEFWKQQKTRKQKYLKTIWLLLFIIRDLCACACACACVLVCSCGNNVNSVWIAHLSNWYQSFHKYIQMQSTLQQKNKSHFKVLIVRSLFIRD